MGSSLPDHADLPQPSQPAGSESTSYDRSDAAPDQTDQIVPPPRDPFDPPFDRPVRAYEPLEVPPLTAARRRPERRWKYAILFLLTFATTTLAGAQFYAGFELDFGNGPLDLTRAQFYLNGFWYSLSILAILGAHEFGHYYACRYYGVDASLPYFLPVPPPLLTGTLGAFIRIRQPIPSKRQLFDIGIAGPIAGFIVAIPVLIIGMNLSRVVRIPADFQGMELGEPLLFKAISWLRWGSPPDGYSINMHPIAFAAWFGLLATALNLFPIGQLDGGHISYAVLGRKSTGVTLTMVLCLIGLTFVSSSWMVWTVLTVVMLLAFGPRHPRTFDEDAPLDTTRRWLAVFAVVMFILCFTPAPIEVLDLVNR
jgi:membrane-associated protease RseP (regulator of RpoE activity)